MIFLIIPLIVLIGICILGGLNSHDGYNDEIWFGWAIGLSVVTFILVLCLWVWPALLTYGEINDLKVQENQLEVIKGRRDNNTEVVKSILDQYPQYEQKIVGSIKPEILFSFPQLRANEVLQDEVKSILDLNDQVYDLQNKIIAKKQAIHANGHNPLFVHFLWWPSS